MLRILDVSLSSLGLLILWPVMLILYFAGLLDTGSPLFRQVRVGRNGQLFVLVKFRTMRVDTASVATHMVDVSAVTRMGHFLRKSKLDELPQLWNVITGDMSLVGPRPCLPSQLELIAERNARCVLNVRPGITGLAQAKGVDMSNPKKLAELDALMIESLSLKTYFKYIFVTLLGSGRGDRVVTDTQD
jgi:O-antigen biosynthesis protein WbqP